MFLQELVTDPWFYFSWIVIVMFSICLHEYAHAAMALKWGDSTAADHGHLTLNPMIQMGPTSLIIMCLIGIAWGAVPVDISRIRRPLGECMVALAGVFANIVLCIIFAGIYVLVINVGGADEANEPIIARFFWWTSYVNGVLFVFNLLPIPILDGWAALSVYIPQMKMLSTGHVRQVSLLLLVIIMVSDLMEGIWEVGYELASFFVLIWEIPFMLLS